MRCNNNLQLHYGRTEQTSGRRVTNSAVHMIHYAVCAHDGFSHGNWTQQLERIATVRLHSITGTGMYCII